MRHAPPLALVLSWLALLALLGFTVLMAYQPLGAFNFPVALTIAAAKALIVAAVWYWLLTIVLSYFQGKLEHRMARSDR